MDKNVPSMPERKMLRLKQVQSRVGLSRSSIYQRIQEGSFPAPIALGKRAVAWDSTEIDAWIDALLSQARTSWASDEVHTHTRAKQAPAIKEGR